MRFLVVLVVYGIAFAAVAQESKIKGHFQFYGLKNRQPHLRKGEVLGRQFEKYLGLGKLLSVDLADKAIVAQGIDRVDQMIAMHMDQKRKVPFTIKDKGRHILGASKVAALKFPSQYLSLGPEGKAHPVRNTVHAKIFYGQKTYQQTTNFLILLPHTNDSLTKLESLAKFVVASAQGEVSVAILVPPLYGKRGLDSDKWDIEYDRKGDVALTYQAPKYMN